ncbi:DUF4942 domain-containing protein [Serratia sp. JSRIV006]|uniref:DUF4942 domain-containing protein n=1 Tax=Serratia sp. JSRIV006 TaxID=2831896 RepID=UPI001CBB257C|nr:DUF4942 domain-containing protein [Serratia sp. JSRIV006]UAN65823.1 DUF4942 domain-containing protein [Serratia sp. JSRIV006]
MNATTSLTTDINPTQAAGEMIPSVAVDRIIAQRNSGIATFLQAIALLQQAREQLLSASGKTYFPDFNRIIEYSLSSPVATEQDKIRRNISRAADREVWQRLMNDTGMFTLMSTKQRDAWDTSLYSDACPEISLDNVLATFKNLHANKADTFEQGLIDVFRSLSWDYKTNNPCCLGKKIILNGMVSSFQDKFYSLGSYGQTRINDLARPFWILDGKNVPDFRVSEGARFSEFMSRGPKQVNQLFTCEYFTIKAFKIGTAHIVFTRPELVDKINDIVARRFPGALPPAV